MQRIFIPTLLIIIGSILSACYNQKTQISESTLINWNLDETGCKGLRKNILLSSPKFNEKLIGIEENNLKEILGNPNETELYVRGQKFIIYYTDCEAEKASKYLRIRINALGLANEVLELSRD